MPEALGLPVLDPAASQTGCCALINPNEWDGRAFTFERKRFVVARTRSVVHIPINMGSVMRRMQAAIDAANVRSPDALILSKDISPWRAMHYVAVTGPVPGMDDVRMSGRFLTKVFDGPYRAAGTWERRLREYAQGQGAVVLQTFFFYTACPRCAKAFGANYVVGFAQVE